MNLKRLPMLAVLLVAAAFPTAAMATGPHDAYLDALPLSDKSHPLKYNDPRIYQADTTTYTHQPDMFDPCFPNGVESHNCAEGPFEPNICKNSHGVESEYGNTHWAYFYANRWGRMTIRTSMPLDSVIGIIPFKSINDATPDIAHGACYDEKRGFEETASGIVTPGTLYAIQVGGTPPGGDKLQVSYRLRKPATVGSATTKANLAWLTNPLRVKLLDITNVPRGSRLKLSCTKHACRKKTIKVKRKSAVAGKLVVPPGAPARSGAKVSMRSALGPAFESSTNAAFKPIVHAAAKRIVLLRKKKVKRGAKIVLRLTSFGHIGRYYRWNVKRNRITPQVNRCMNPGSSKPRKKCSG